MLWGFNWLEQRYKGLEKYKPRLPPVFTPEIFAAISDGPSLALIKRDILFPRGSPPAAPMADAVAANGCWKGLLPPAFAMFKSDAASLLKDWSVKRKEKGEESREQWANRKSSLNR